MSLYIETCKYIHSYIQILYIFKEHTISFQTFFVWALLLIVHTWNSCPLRSNLFRLQRTCCTVLTTGRKVPWKSSCVSVSMTFVFVFLCLGEPAYFHWELCLLVIAVDPAFIASHQRLKNCGIWIDQRNHLPAVMTTFFFLIFSEHPWDKHCANLQFLANNYVYSSHTDIKLCTYCFYRHKTVLIHVSFYLANQLWCSDFLTPPTPLIIPHRLPAFLESLMSLKNWCSIHARCSKSSLKHSIRFCGIFSKFETEFYSISFF